jgi:putative CocE/NonD family hydrolase
VATGAPLAHLWIASSASDGDFFVYLCEVDREDRSWYVTEGALRASHRRGSDRARFAPLPPQGLTELRIELLPVSNLFDAGHRVRLVVTGADADNCATPPREPPPIVTFAWGPGRRARLELPVRWR